MTTPTSFADESEVWQPRLFADLVVRKENLHVATRAALNVIARYTKVTADTEKQIREAVAVFDEIRATKENVMSIRARRRSA